MKNKILVIVAHPDDEVLGVGGTILKHIHDGDEVDILILGDGETSRDSGTDIHKREEQARNASKVMGVKNIFLEKYLDNQFDTIPLLTIIKKIESVLEEVKPSIIYTHYYNDLNIDHCLVSRAVVTACRPNILSGIKKILVFETPSSTEWQIKDQSHIFCPTEYNNIADFIDKKLDILKIYKDELADYPHPRSIEGIKILAQYRALESGFKYAEAFQLIRSLHN